MSEPEPNPADKFGWEPGDIRWEDGGEATDTDWAGMKEEEGDGADDRTDMVEYASVRRLPPPDAPVVAGSTPVVSFGDPGTAEVATLGINPSRREFLDADGRLLDGSDRRLATTASIGSDRLDQLTDAQASMVITGCSSYFTRNPYRHWFDPLDRLLRTGLGVSYYDGTACHLDLVQWATDPIWGKIGDAGVRAALLNDGLLHLAEQLRSGNLRLVLLNGRQVIDQVQATGLAPLAEAGHLPMGHTTCRLVRGERDGIVFAGWSTNLQSGWGVTNAFKSDLAAWLAEHLAESHSPETTKRPGSTAPTGNVMDENGHLLPGIVVRSKDQLLRILMRWLEESSAATIGDVGTFGGRAHLRIDLDGTEVVLNADTKRAAVTAYTHLARRHGPDAPWKVIGNRRGVVNKVLPGAAIDAIPGWYCYLSHPRTTPGPL
jgi:hypothetical protein